MNVKEAIKARRSVKHFDKNHKMSAEEQKELFNLAIQAPTAFNIQHWRFLLLEDKELREQVRKLAWDQSQVTDASLLIVLCADLKAWNKNPAQYWRNAPQEVQDFMLPAIKDYYENKEVTQRDEAMRSCGIVAQTIMLAAKGMDYDSCPMDGFDFDAVGKLINLPEDYLISMFIAVGKGTEEARPKGGQVSVEELIFRDKF